MSRLSSVLQGKSSGKSGVNEKTKDKRERKRKTSIIVCSIYYLLSNNKRNVNHHTVLNEDDMTSKEFISYPFNFSQRSHGNIALVVVVVFLPFLFYIFSHEKV